MQTWNPTTVVELLLHCGRLALDHQQNLQTERKADFSLVTAADAEIEDYLITRLSDPAGGVHVIGEETSGTSTAQSIATALNATAWIVDPIDGTAPYANRLPTWGISIGFMRAGVIEEGALFLPGTGDLFVTNGAEVLYQRGSRDPEYWQFDRLTPLPHTPNVYRSTGMVSLPQDLAHTTRFTGRNPVQAIGAAVYSAAELVLGRYLCYVARIKLWDLAGAIPILRRLGYQLQYADGTHLSETISADHWILDPHDPRCWKCKGLLYVAQDQATIDYLIKHYIKA